MDHCTNDNYDHNMSHDCSLLKEFLLAKSIFHSSSVGMVIVDKDQEKILMYNNSFKTLWNIPNTLIEQKQFKPILQHMQAMTNNPLIMPINSEIFFTSDIHLNNNNYFEQISNNQYIENDLIGVIHKFRNITVRKMLENQLENQASYDQLTGLANSSLLTEMLQKNIAAAKRNNESIAVLFIDLDSFKAINDTFGHKFGDKLLKIFGSRLKKYVREEDIVGRLGGDEFVIIMKLNNKELENFHKIIERFFKYIVQPYNISAQEQEQEQELIVTISIGISFYPNNGTDALSLIKNADAAMYNAKGKGKNTFQIYDQDMSEKLSARLQLEHDLHIAIQNNELALYYQPVIDLKTNKIKSMEALIRWHHPKLGLIPPSTLIPIAESSGTIFPIGLWVLKTACNQIKTWQDNNFPPTKISINISECQIKQDDIVKTIKHVIDDTKIEAQYLEIEISEKIFLSTGNIILPKLCGLKELGIGVNLDQFGTCYSQFATLKHFPIDCIKIDRVLIKSFMEHPELDGLIKSIATVAVGLKLNIVAEGIENEEQLKIINKIFTGEAQGYFFSKPLPADEVSVLLKNQSK